MTSVALFAADLSWESIPFFSDSEKVDEFRECFLMVFRKRSWSLTTPLGRRRYFDTPSSIVFSVASGEAYALPRVKAMFATVLNVNAGINAVKLLHNFASKCL